MVAPPPLVAHVVHRFDYGGLENGVVNLLNRMPPGRYRHAVIALAGANPRFASRVTRDDVPVLSVDKKPGKDPGAYVRLWRTLRRLRPDVVHTRNLGTVDTQWIAWACRVRARVHGEHGWSAGDPRGLDRRNLAIRKFVAPVIHRYVAMSKDIATWLAASVGAPSTSIRQIYNGVDTAKFSPDGAVPADFPWQRSQDGDRPVVIGTVGRMDPIKNQVGLMRAFGSLLDRDPQLRGTLRLALVGDGPERAELERTRALLGLEPYVWMPGARDDVAEVMRALDVFVLPSINEGISNTILEAMATGRPIVAARVGGNPELILDGMTGALYEGSSEPGMTDDVAPLAAALEPYAGDRELRETHGAAARRRALQAFSLDAMVAGYLALYDEVLGQVAGDRFDIRISQGMSRH